MRSILISLCIAAASLVAVPVSFGQPADSPWPMFHGDSQRTGRSDHAGPVTAAVRWSYRTGFNIIDSSPVLGLDGALYGGGGGDNTVYAFDTATGTLRWSYLTGYMTYTDSSVGSDGTLYMGSYDCNLYAFNPDGALRWSYRANNRVRSSPAFDDEGGLYAGSWDGQLYSLGSSGALRWSYQCSAGSFEWGAPALMPDGDIVFGTNPVFRLTAAGSALWSYGVGVDIRSSTVIGGAERIHFGTGDNRICTLASNGAFAWSYRAAEGVTASAAIGSDGTLYQGSYDNNFYALNSNGTLRWSFVTGDNIYGSAAIDSAGRIYVGSHSNDNRLYCLTSNGALLWSYKGDGHGRAPRRWGATARCSRTRAGGTTASDPR